MFPPEYERLPKNVHFKYNGEKMVLSEGAEEVMGFYAAMLRTGSDKYLLYLPGLSIRPESWLPIRSDTWLPIT